MTQHALLSANISRTFTHHIKVASCVKGGGGWGTGSTKQKTNAENNFEASTVQMYLLMVNCCKTGIEVSKYVYLACMTVIIEHTVDGHNHDILQQCITDVYASQVWGLDRSKTCQIICFDPSKLICLHEK